MLRFFTPEPLLDSGEGFSLYDPAHWIALLLCALLIAWLCRSQRSVAPEQRLRGRRWVGAAALLCELLRLGSFLLQGCLTRDYLPLHLCSLMVFLLFWHSRRPNAGLGELLYCAGMPGALLALLFPNWGCYAAWQFHSLLAFLGHSLLVAYPLMLVLSGECRPLPRRLPACFLALLVMAVPVYIFNVFFDTNYMFLLRPSKGSPLGFFAEQGGYAAYLLSYLAAMALAWAALYAPFARKGTNGCGE